MHGWVSPLQGTCGACSKLLPTELQAMAVSCFPAHTRLVFQRLMEVLKRGTDAYQVASIAIMQTIFSIPGMPLGSFVWFAEDSELMQLLSGMISGPLGPHILDLFQAMLQFRGNTMKRDEAGSVAEGLLEWKNCMDDLGECNKLCAEAMARVVQACPGSAALLAVHNKGQASSGASNTLLPFLSKMSNE